MGWKNDGKTGLGKQKQGISQPIDVVPNISRFGFGYKADLNFDEDLVEIDVYDEKEAAMAMAMNTVAKNETNENKYDENNKNNDEEMAMQVDNFNNDCVTSKEPKSKQLQPQSQQQQHQQKSGKRQQKQETTKTNSFVNQKPLLYLFKENIRKLLLNYVHTESDESDIVFEKGLNPDQRKLIHQEAHRLGLKTKSQGVNADRFLVVSKKLSAQDIVESAKKNGGAWNNFQLISKD